MFRFPVFKYTFRQSNSISVVVLKGTIFSIFGQAATCPAKVKDAGGKDE
jgi:hypothetical protein